MFANHAREAFGPAVHASLGAECTVGVLGFAFASDIDDAAPLALNHLINQSIGYLTRTMEIQCDGFLPSFFTDMKIFEAARAACVVDQNIDATQTFQCCLG